MHTSKEKPQLQILALGDRDLQEEILLALYSSSPSMRTAQSPTKGLPPDLQHESEAQIYFYTLAQEDASLWKNIIDRAPGFDGAILFTRGDTTNTQRDALRMLSLKKTPLLVFFSPTTRSQQQIDLTEQDLRQLCTSCGFAGDELTIIRGDIVGASRSLSEACDRIFSPLPQPKQSFFLPIEDIFEIRGRGVVVTGMVARGEIKTGQEVELLGIRTPRSLQITAVESFRKLKDIATQGMNVGLLTRGIKKNEIERGQLLTQPGTMHAVSRFEAEVKIEDEAAFPGGIPALGVPFKIALWTWKGQATLLSGELHRGAFSLVELLVERPIALETGATFALIIDNQSAGVGVVRSHAR